MISEIVGAVLVWALGTIAIGEWFALKRMDAQYNRLEDRHRNLLKAHKALVADHTRLMEKKHVPMD